MRRKIAVLALLLALPLAKPVLARAEDKPTIPVAVVIERGEFADKATEDLEKLAKKFIERLTNGKVKLASLVEDPSQATIIVKLLSKEWQATGNTTTSGGVTANKYTGVQTHSKTTEETAFGVYGAIIVGESGVPFNLRLSPGQIFNKDNTLSGMLDKHVEDFIKRNFEKLSASKK